MQEEIKKLKELIKSKNKNICLRRVQCVYLKLQHNWNSKQIAEVIGYCESYVREILSLYKKNGDIIFQLINTGGRIRENMTVEEESELIAGFKEEAGKGNIVEVSRIHEAYEKKLGRKVYRSVIYDLLDRQGWRRIMPRPKHQKNNKEKMEIFKKGRLSSNNQESKR